MIDIENDIYNISQDYRLKYGHVIVKFTLVEILQFRPTEMG